MPEVEGGGAQGGAYADDSTGEVPKEIVSKVSFRSKRVYSPHIDFDTSPYLQSYVCDLGRERWDVLD